MTSPRWLRPLAASLPLVVVVLLARSVLVIVEESRLNSARSSCTVLALAWLTVAVVATAALSWVFLAARKELDRGAQVVAATGSTCHDWIWESDRQDRITYSNPAVTELLGYRPQELLGISMFDLLLDEPARRRAREIRAGWQRDGQGWDDVELNWAHKDGSAVAMQGSAAPIRDRKGHLVGFRGTRRLLGDDRRLRAVVVAARQRVADALATGAVDMALQPIVDLTSGRITGVEALARFHDGRTPDVWFADARHAGRARQLDQCTFTAALDLLASIPEPVYLSINASPELLMNPGFRERLNESPLLLSRLVIEITEHARVADYGDLNAALAPLRARGVRFAIDDTGAGYASLSHVLQLNPDIIKLDRALIAHLDDDRARRSLVTALVLLALDVGATVTGEGVETDTQADTLRTLGVDQAQGYLLARPTTDPTQWATWWTRTWGPRGIRPEAGQRPTH
jgi:PAS domain S-box-containing protein